MEFSDKTKDINTLVEKAKNSLFAKDNKTNKKDSSMNRKVITINTEKQFTNLNSQIEEFLKDKKGDGFVNIFVQHTTCSIKILEGELLLLADINNFLENLVPQENNYMHNKIEIREVPVNERTNAHSHLRQLMFPTSETIPVKDGKMMLGKWQSVFLIEFDPIRDRNVVMSYWEI